ncbi:MAG: hypothetical protein ABMB14_16265 [Myxococcota bacterium]
MWFIVAAAHADDGAKARVAPLGVDRLAEVGALSFTFNVEKDGQLKASRSWTWHPVDGTVTRKLGDEVTTFVFGKPSGEVEQKADAQFVNDTFWLAPQLHLRWAGPDLTVTDGGDVPPPLAVPGGAATTHLVTMQYAPTGGGYTPGDAYDLYLDPSGKIVAWNYREGGAAAPTMTTTFDGYVAVGPLTLATEHRSADGAFRLYFTELSVSSAGPTPSVSPAGPTPAVTPAVTPAH